MGFRLCFPSKTEDKENDGHCCSSCENQNQGFRGRMRKNQRKESKKQIGERNQRKKEFEEEEIKERKNLRKKKSEKDITDFPLGSHE